jgi:D-beta-D-heptose 7-phosphate kinase/D-beta-D-heptose 1-phosphate adenosyltransferase
MSLTVATDPQSPELARLVVTLLEDASHFESRYVADYARITEIVDVLRGQGRRIVLTSGSFDILHQGHSMYLEAARNCGDFLIVGVDDDEKIRERKGPSRPIVPERERLRMLTHQRGVGIVTLKSPRHARWALIKAVRPDVLVVTQETYSAIEIQRLKEYCGEVAVMPRMAEVSTTARLRLVTLEGSQALAERLSNGLPELLLRALPDLIGDAVPGLIQQLVDEHHKS